MVTTSIYALVREAILTKKQISAMYRGHRRELSPHVLGWKNGKEHGLFYQFGGASSSGLEPDGSPNNWRCLDISELTDVQIVDGAFHTAPNHTRPQTCVGEVDVVVAY